MTLAIKTRWDSSRFGPLTESTVRTLHGPPKNARVSSYNYPAGDEIEGTSKPCIGYLIKGHVVFRSGGQMYSLEPDDVFEFGGGNYTMSIDPSVDAVVIWVWDLPLGFG